MKKHVCTISHHDDLPSGGFKAYEAGQVYEFDKEPCQRYFTPYMEPTGTDKENRRGVKADGK